MSESTKTIYLHMPKAGGTSLYYITKRQYPPGKLFKLQSRRYEEHWAEYEQLDISKKQNFDAYFGHFQYGVHHNIPSPCQYVTMLREPVSRVVSLHRYMLARPSSKFWTRTPDDKASSLKAFLEGEYSLHASNGLLRLLLDDFNTPNLNDTHLEDTIQRLKREFIIGIMEKYDESLFYFSQRLNWKHHFCYTIHNSAAIVSEADSHEELELIRKYNQLDIQLYKWAAAHFEREFEAFEAKWSQRARSFSVRNRVYSSMNAMLAPLLPVFRPIKVAVRPLLKRTIRRGVEL